jgi:hypothetical protein
LLFISLGRNRLRLLAARLYVTTLARENCASNAALDRFIARTEWIPRQSFRRAGKFSLSVGVTILCPRSKDAFSLMVEGSAQR